jgi:molybdopterin biosynthesis enzyme MoaB
MTIHVTNVSVNYLEDSTKVTLEIYTMQGTVEKLKDKLILTLPGQYNSIDDTLMGAVEEELTRNGINYTPLVN